MTTPVFALDVRSRADGTIGLQSGCLVAKRVDLSTDTTMFVDCNQGTLSVDSPQSRDTSPSYRVASLPLPSHDVVAGRAEKVMSFCRWFIRNAFFSRLLTTPLRRGHLEQAIATHRWTLSTRTCRCLLLVIRHQSRVSCRVQAHLEWDRGRMAIVGPLYCAADDSRFDRKAIDREGGNSSAWEGEGPQRKLEASGQTRTAANRRGRRRNGLEAAPCWSDSPTLLTDQPQKKRCSARANAYPSSILLKTIER